MPMVGMRLTFLLSLILLLLGAPSSSRAAKIQLYGLNYNTRQGPDWDWNKCKSRIQVLTELSLLQKLTSRIRLLSLTDCGQGELVLDVAKELGIQVWLGLWVAREDEVFLREKAAFQSLLERGMIDDDTVLGVTVGSESIYREEVTVLQIIGYKDQIKDILIGSGKADLPVSIVDIAPEYEWNPHLTEAVDIVYTNSFPFWEDIPIDESIDFLYSQIDPILKQPQAGNKKFILGETGWPSDGALPGLNQASPERQAQYFQDFFCKVDRESKWSYFYFTGIDNSWRRRQDPENTIEGNWGFFYDDLTLKPHFQNMRFSCPGSSEVYSFSEIDFTIPKFGAEHYTPPPTTKANCKLHEGCAGLGGNCCPTNAGDYLGCCNPSAAAPPTTTTSTRSSGPVFPTFSPIAVATPKPTDSPTVAPIAAAPQPTASPTIAPMTEAPVVSPVTQKPVTQSIITPNPTAALLEGAPVVISIVAPPKIQSAPTRKPVVQKSMPSSNPTAAPIIVEETSNAEIPDSMESITADDPTSTPDHETDDGSFHHWQKKTPPVTTPQSKAVQVTQFGAPAMMNAVLCGLVSAAVLPFL